MGMRISYSDTVTGEELGAIELDDQEVDAFNYIAYDIKEWISTAIRHRARKAVNSVCEDALSECKQVNLSASDKEAIGKRTGLVSTTSLDVNEKKEIVKKAVFESVKERTVKPRSILE